MKNIILFVVTLFAILSCTNYNNSTEPINISNDSVPITDNDNESEEKVCLDTLADVKVILLCGPSCVNGYDVNLKVTNKSDKAIKYLRCLVYGINRVGDIVNDDMYRNCIFEGPVEVGESRTDGSWTIYLSGSVKKNTLSAKIIEIEYMDGTSVQDYDMTYEIK